MQINNTYFHNKHCAKLLKIEAIIRSSKIYDVQAALADIGIPTFSSYEVKISGIHKGHATLRNKASDFIPKSKIEILCADRDQDKIIKTVLDAAKTGEQGDGIIFVYQVANLVKIRDSQIGESALK